MDAQELWGPEKLSTIWVKNLNSAVKKMSHTTSSMICMKPKDEIKTPFHRTKHIQKKRYYLNMAYTDIFINLGNNMEIKNDGQQTLFGVKIRIN